MRQPSMISRLPAPLALEFGQAIAGYAFLEFRLSSVAYDLLGITAREGRIAIREPECTERLDMIFALADMKGVDLGIDRADIRTAVDECQRQRNQLAHAVWLQDPETGAIFIQRSRFPSPRGLKRARKAGDVEGIPYDADQARALAQLIDGTTHMVDQMGAMVLAAADGEKGR
jgi:hypothetical protein